MLIEQELLRFCAEKTREIAAEYDKACVIPGKDDGFPRSADDLHLIMHGRHGLPIFHKEIRIPWRQSKVRSFYIPYPDRIEIWYASGMPSPYLRYYKTKELLQIHLWREDHATTDVVELVHNMRLREAPSSIDLDLGHKATSDTLGEIAAMEFLFPFARRLACIESALGTDGVEALAKQYGVPPFVVQTCLNNIEGLRGFF